MWKSNDSVCTYICIDCPEKSKLVGGLQYDCLDSKQRSDRIPCAESNPSTLYASAHTTRQYYSGDERKDAKIAREDNGE